MAELRITEKEAKAIGTLVIAVGDFSAWSLNNMFRVPKKRAKEIKEMNLTRGEIDYIRSFIPDKEGVTK